MSDFQLKRIYSSVTEFVIEADEDVKEEDDSNNDDGAKRANYYLTTAQCTDSGLSKFPANLTRSKSMVKSY